MSTDVIDRIRATVDTCPPAERRVAIALLGNGAVFGMRSSAELAAAVATSQPSVIRFIQRIGFSRYSEFQAALRESLGSPGEPPMRPGPTAAVSYGDQVVEATSRTLDDLGDRDDALVPLVKASRVIATGGSVSRMAAHYLVAQIRERRNSVTVVDRDPYERAIAAAEMGEKDLAVVFDYPRYEEDSAIFARLCKDAGSHILLFTDPAGSPIGRLADVVISTRAVPLSGGNSLVPVFAVIDQLAIAVESRIGRRALTKETLIADNLRSLGKVP